MKWARLLRALPIDLRDAVAGDLEEEYLALRSRRGAAVATVWAWWTAARLAVAFRLERATHTRGVPPIAEELRTRTHMWDDLRQDVAFSLRMLRRQPGFTAVALVALALGIGANTAIFSIVDTVLWRQLPYVDADRIMSLAEQRPREGRWFGVVAPADYFDWKRENRSFAAMAAIAFQPVNSPVAANLTGSGEPERVRSMEVSPAFLGVLGIAPALGRDFLPEEEIDGRDRVVLLADRLWRRRFGADPAIVGRTVAINGVPYEVIGVLPARFWWPTQPELMVPLALDDHDRTLRSAHFLDVIGRLRPGVTRAQAADDLGAIGAQLARDFPAENANHFPNLRPLRDTLVGDVRPAMLILLSAVGFVMLIACANVATLLLARATGRHKELAVRRAVGATRVRLVRQMLTESVVVGLAGGIVGLLIASWGLAVFRIVLPAQFAGLPGIANVAIDGRVLTAAFALSVATAILFGLVPSLVSSDVRIGPTLAAEARGASGSARAGRIRTALVATELALSLVLLIGAALLMVSFWNLLNVSPGFVPSQLLTSKITLPGSAYPNHARVVAFYEALDERIRGIPGVRQVAVTTSLPFQGPDSRLNLDIENRVDDSPVPVRAHPRLISPEYFETMGIPLVRGRSFSPRDRESAPDVVIINEAAARRYWPGADPIGHRVSLGSPSRWREIVGVVADIRHEGLDADTDPAAYVPYAQAFTSLGTGFERMMTVVIRTSADAASMTATLRRAVAAIDPQVPIGMLSSMTDVIDDTVAPRRLNLLLVSAFAVLALVLTSAGLYGVMAYVVAQRTREIGVRMALGATSGNVRRMVMRQAGGIAGLGILIGIAGALALTRFMSSLLFGVSASDPRIYAGVTLLLAAVTAAAVAVPSVRATRIDPLIALRDS